ncbi:MAG: hypothetical protein ACJ8AT_06250 [Hyalangium sp.]|uniref:hypothetical protein n=1 Tax=Hyalangium sp. TaxID=2028555 RepID=UPI003899C722
MPRAVRRPSRCSLLVLLPLLTLGLPGCALFHAQPSAPLPAVSPCEAWKAAALAWQMVNLTVERQIEVSQAQACTLPPALPPAATP